MSVVAAVRQPDREDEGRPEARGGGRVRLDAGHGDAPRYPELRHGRTVTPRSNRALTAVAARGRSSYVRGPAAATAGSTWAAKRCSKFSRNIAASSPALPS